MLKSIYIGFTFHHHGEHSGYDQIKKYLEYDKILDCQKSFDFLQKISNRKNFFDRVYFKLFGGQLWWIDFLLIFLSIRNPKKYILNNIF
jgi:hypothetical protein